MRRDAVYDGAEPRGSGRVHKFERFLCVAGIVLLAGCASTKKPPAVPYPAFVQSELLPDVYIAALPRVRAKQYASDMRTRTTSNRVEFPPDWSGTTGGAPGKSLELYVLAGTLKLSDFELSTGGYAYIPPGSLGFRLETDTGARALYFLDDVDSSSIIRSPLILDSGLVAWEERAAGTFVKELRADPGSGATTWLLRVEPGAAVPWHASSAAREGYLLEGEYRHSECPAGEALTWTYLPGGYFRRPADAVNGGPESRSLQSSVWFLRELEDGELSAASCSLPEPAP